MDCSLLVESTLQIDFENTWDEYRVTLTIPLKKRKSENNSEWSATNIKSKLKRRSASEVVK